MGTFFSYAGDYWPGMLVTIQVTVLSFAIGMVIACAIAVCRVSPIPPLRIFGTVYVELFRNTPLLVLLFILFFGFPKIGLQWSGFTTAIIGLALYTGAYAGEILRSGLNTVPGGQAEAARAIGLPFGTVMVEVVLPQAVRAVVPPLGSLFLAMIRNSAVVSVVAVSDLVKVGDNVVTNKAGAFNATLGVMVGYLILTVPTAIVVKVLERRAAISR